MELDLHATLFAVCRLPPEDAVPSWADRMFQPLVSITRTTDELSIVLPQAEVPSHVQAASDWRALSVRGPLPFQLTGIFRASLAAPLAEAGVPIFALSTHDTDWLLVAHDRVGEACAALENAGHRIHDAAATTGEASGCVAELTDADHREAVMCVRGSGRHRPPLDRSTAPTSTVPCTGVMAATEMPRPLTALTRASVAKRNGAV